MFYRDCQRVENNNIREWTSYDALLTEVGDKITTKKFMSETLERIYEKNSKNEEEKL